MSPFNAWVMTKGLETLYLRVKYMCESAQKIAYFLSNSTNVQSVIYPGLETHPQYNLAKKQMSNSGTVVSFEIEGGRKEAFKVLNELKIIDISNNLGDSKSLITHPATTTHQRLSEDNRIQIRSLLNSIWGGVANQIKFSRSVSTENFNKIVDNLEATLPLNAFRNNIVDGIIETDLETKEQRIINVHN